MKKHKKDRSQRRGPGRVLLTAGLALAVLLLVVVLLLRAFSGGDGPAPSLAPSPSAALSPALSPSAAPEPTPSPVPTDGLSLLQALRAQNQDAVGWLKIEGTRVDYPVMFTPEDPEYYLHRDENGQEEVAGCLFIDGGCTVEPRSANLLIHGHNMLNGSMFRDLLSYKEESFYQEHPLVEYSTPEGTETYEILAVFLSQVYKKTDTDVFKFYQFYDAANAQEFDSYVASCKASQLYETGVTAQYGDKLITLSTCEYSRPNGRMVVVARCAVDPPQA